jgi:hypothetical protein
MWHKKLKGEFMLYILILIIALCTFEGALYFRDNFHALTFMGIGDWLEQLSWWKRWLVFWLGPGAITALIGPTLWRWGMGVMGSEMSIGILWVVVHILVVTAIGAYLLPEGTSVPIKTWVGFLFIIIGAALVH